MADSEEDFRPNPMLFGRKLADIPCYRSTFLYSTCSGLGGTMLYFLFTSKMKKAINVGMGVFASVTLSYWCYCRYNYSHQKFQVAQLQEAMRRYNMEADDDDSIRR